MQDRTVGHQPIPDRDATVLVAANSEVAFRHVLGMVRAQVIWIVGLLALRHLDVVRMQLVSDVHLPLCADSESLGLGELVIGLHIAWTTYMALYSWTTPVGASLVLGQRAADREELGIPKPAGCFSRTLLPYLRRWCARRGPAHCDDVPPTLQRCWLRNRGE